jgi:hypothetical protein
VAELIHYIGSEPDEIGGAFLGFVARALAKGAETLAKGSMLEPPA